MIIMNQTKTPSTANSEDKCLMACFTVAVFPVPGTPERYMHLCVLKNLFYSNFTKMELNTIYNDDDVQL